MTIIDDNWIYKQSITGVNRDVETIITGDTDGDYVRVVRCKNCKNSVCIGERYFCDIQYDKWGQPYVVNPDGYCDEGERRETK